MFKDFNKEIENKLLEQKKELEIQLQKMGERDKTRDGFKIKFPQFGDKEDENAEEVSAFGDRLSLGLNLEKRLAEVENSLAKIKKGVYGVCEQCKRKMDKKRLMAFSTAKFCIDCHSKESNP